jgi:ADP-dependent phosphofructokinase/glucokinase
MTEPIAGLVLDHVPPDGELLNVVVAPTQTVKVPVIGVGIAYTVTIAVV